MTEKLFWENPYEKTFEAKVEKTTPEGLILDKTLFYPQGGGQDCDKGFILHNSERYEVLSVTKEDNYIIHHLKPDVIERFNVGDMVKGNIDWEYRYGLMKAHTSQHIISAIARNKFDNETNRAFISFEDVTLQFERKLTVSDLKSLIKEANLIFSNETRVVLTETLKRKEFNANNYNIRGKIPDKEIIRIVHIEGLDQVCCGGTHVELTNEIGQILVYRFHKNLEIRYLLGKKSLNNFSDVNIDLVNSLEKSKQSIFDIAKVINEYNSKVNKTSDLLAKLQLAFLNHMSVKPRFEINGNFVNLVSSEIDDKLLRKEFKKFPDNSILVKIENDTRISVYSKSETINANELVKLLIEYYEGKGGGSNFSAQCVLSQEVNDIEDKIVELIKNSGNR